MKLPLFFCCLLLSVQGWCASVVPSPGAANVIPAGQETLENVVIAGVLITYLSAITWWAITAKHSLDKTLQDVLQGIAQYS